MKGQGDVQAGGMCKKKESKMKLQSSRKRVGLEHKCHKSMNKYRLMPNSNSRGLKIMLGVRG